jgi:hypothetical protein
VPKAFLKYREGGPPIAGLRELPPLEQNGRPLNSNGQWVAVEGADAETMSGHDLKKILLKNPLEKEVRNSWGG